MSNKYQVIIQPEAEQGIKEAYYWISSYSPRNARSWLEGIYKAIMTLEQMPLRCSVAFENNFFEEEIRQLLYPNFSQNLRSPNTEALQEVGLNRAIADFPNQQSVVRF
ncbi:type II toxin-antitoxin system RelE/ParE family toxin [Crocosphaera watsonii WH 8501]|uniref:Type II toxin-antitoxin system RelE/ParE family toxin n=2 Tax=Crocosphaera watsonii TaxID=263511 RepID=Q4C3A6_CROWT|nr:type II toxin-antitoxin system RelE/ParE family toxin [Crocosphaera watsonii]EAM50645.1 hypothetical protein CwatDRAFT_3610 [Crocosphaera watsonii WH 8501]